MSHTPLSDIPTLTHLYQHSKLSPASTTTATANPAYNDTISLIRTDITRLAVDSIVNAANTSLLGGGGVDGAIHAAAGPDLLTECRALNGCDTGDAKITNAHGRLGCKKVVHAVGPVYGSAKKKGVHAELLAGCYTRSLQLAVENGCKSIAFSCLSTGVYGYPSEEAAETALRAVKGWLDADGARAGKLERIVFCCFLEKDENAYEKYLPRFFPPTTGTERTATRATDEEATAAAGAKERSTEAAERTPGANGESEMPQLPDVPTNEPTEQGQPEAKKVRLDASAVRDEEAK